MRQFLVALIVAATLGAGCSRPGAAPGAPTGPVSAPSAPTGTESPAGTGGQPGTGGTKTPPTQAGPVPGATPLPYPCKEFPFIVEPAGPESPVKATIYLEDDPGIASRVLAWVTPRPMTIHILFDGPVQQATFRPAFFENSCTAQRPVAQEVSWLSDQEAVIRVTEAPPVHAEYAVTLGAGKDQAGLMVAEPAFILQTMQDLPTLKVAALPLDGSEPRIIFERNDALSARSVSPDGRYLLAVRKPIETLDTHSPTKIPYIFDLQTGTRLAFPQAAVEQIRWDLPNRAVWINGWQRLSLDGTVTTFDPQTYLPADDHRNLLAQLSPDGRWLAVLRDHDPAQWPGRADLVLVDLTTGKAETLPEAVGWAGMEAPPAIHMDWAPDSAALLLASYEKDVPSFSLLDPATLKRRPLPVTMTEYSIATFSPGGTYILVGRHGIITPDGQTVVADTHLWSGDWSPDDRYLLTYGANDTFDLLEVATGARRSIPRPRGFGLLLSFAADGSTIYLAGR